MTIRKKALVAVVFAVGLSAGLLLSGLGTETSTSLAGSQNRQNLRKKLHESGQAAAQLEQTFQNVAEYVRPAVVFIQTKKEIEAPQMPPNPFLRRFFDEDDLRRFRERRQRKRQKKGVGSGFIIDQEGHVVTNAHVVKSADEVKIKMTDGRTTDAKVTGIDEETDLAVLKMKGEYGDLNTLDLGSSTNVQPGQWVIAVGHPFGLQYTVSAGIVSATGRQIGIAQYENLIQTDAAINPGNSGGPLVNLKGEVIGINAAISSPGRAGNVGIGFAIPADMAKSVVAALKKGKEVRRGYLGIYGRDITPQLAKRFDDYGGSAGALVNEVMDDTPAATAEPVKPEDAPKGLKPGDIIMRWDGKKIEDFADLRLKVASTPPGESATVKVWRNGSPYVYKVTVAPRQKAVMEQQGGWIGLQVQDLTAEMRRRIGEPDLKGVLVANVSQDSPARRYIEAGDVILSLNRQRITSVEQYRDIIARTSAEKGVLIRYLDADTGRTRFVAVGG